MGPATQETQSNAAPRNILILGGGTAGWMTANLLALAFAESATRITLIESQDIGTLGVGEGSTPLMRQFFHQLAIAEEEWMPATNATYKCGISFVDWSRAKGFERYFHPFFSRLDLKPASAFFHNCELRRAGHRVAAHPDDFFVSAELARQNKSPKPMQPLPFANDYAYHFDAGLLGQFLKQKATARGVTHLVGNVLQIQRKENGDIASLSSDPHGELTADLFFDCSGFAGLLINKTLGEPFTTFKENLFNDAAVAIPTPRAPGAPMPSETVSTALKYGWVWRIPLTNRFGNGYVYASDFISPQQAEQELRAHLGDAAKDSEARHLRMRVGRVSQHWRNNCVAVGLSQGFIEPLEATALGLVQFTIEEFIRQYRKGGYGERHRADFNRAVNRAFDGTRDYIVLHYQMSQRQDSEYWRANGNNSNISDSLARIIQAWDGAEDFDTVLQREANTQVYMKPSWYCMLAGTGRFPANTGKPLTQQPAVPAKQAREACSAMARMFYDHNDYLQRLTTQQTVTNSS